MSLCAIRQYRNASKLDHRWVCGDWLESLGLSQYSGVFESQLVDARLLNVLSKKDLDKHLNIHNKFHQSSILHGIQLLRMCQFDTQVTALICSVFITSANVFILIHRTNMVAVKETPTKRLD